MVSPSMGHFKSKRKSFLIEQSFEARAQWQIQKSNLDLTSKILIADDEVFNIEAMKGMLKILGLPKMKERVVCCFNGEEMVDKIKEAFQQDDPQRYSLILTDCSMPIMDGYEAVAQIRLKFRRRKKMEIKQSLVESEDEVEDEPDDITRIKKKV